MKSYHWLILILALALAAVSIRLAVIVNSQSADSTPESTADAAIECIMTRSSVRQYSDKTVPDSLIEKILKAGMASPSAANKQPWEFYVVTDQALKDSICTASPYASMVSSSAFSVVVCGNMDRTLDEDGREYWVQDCSAASENMLLAAHALGIGSVWCGFYPQLDRVRKLSAIMSLPENIVPMCVIAFGYPVAPATPKEKWEPTRVHYN